MEWIANISRMAELTPPSKIYSEAGVKVRGIFKKE